MKRIVLLLVIGMMGTGSVNEGVFYSDTFDTTDAAGTALAARTDFSGVSGSVSGTVGLKTFAGPDPTLTGTTLDVHRSGTTDYSWTEDGTTRYNWAAGSTGADILSAGVLHLGFDVIVNNNGDYFVLAFGRPDSNPTTSYQKWYADADVDFGIRVGTTYLVVASNGTETTYNHDSLIGTWASVDVYLTLSSFDLGAAATADVYINGVIVGSQGFTIDTADDPF